MINATADAALLATYHLALWFRERRLLIDGAVCPRLVDGTRAVMAIVTHRATGRTAPSLEVMAHVDDDGIAGSPRAAALAMSGGADALAALRENLLTTPATHPARVTLAPFIFGLNTYDFDDATPNAARHQAHQAHIERLTQLVAPSGIRLVPIATNVRTLYPSFAAWGEVVHAAPPLAIVAHAMRRHMSSLAIASSGKGEAESILQIEALHAFHSSHAVTIQPAQLMVTRLEKLRRIAQWPEGLAVLRVCLMIEIPANDAINCGRCEKCVRTMLLLMIVGGDALARAPFPEPDVQPAAIARLSFNTVIARQYYLELGALLAGIGRDDLSAAIARGLARPAAEEGPPPSGWRAWWQRTKR